IKSSYPVVRQELPLKEALNSGALGFFGTKYPDVVSVYTVGNNTDPYSREICTGPHVLNTSEIGNIKLTREESAGAGRRRIYAVINS
ncbi:MAG: alanine--tRNA ligase, partial [Candidatus Shapirobacteria bacterium]